MDIKSGLAFHCHHDQLCEYVYDYDERVAFIKNNKPPEERELRLSLFKLIPIDKIPGYNGKAREALDKAREAYDKAREALDKAREAYGKARKAYDKAREAYDKAWKAYDKAREAYLKEYGTQIEELHKELCPNCPWDGKTIFPKLY